MDASIGGDNNLQRLITDKEKLMWNVIIPAVVTVIMDQLLSDD